MISDAEIKELEETLLNWARLPAQEKHRTRIVWADNCISQLIARLRSAEGALKTLMAEEWRDDSDEILGAARSKARAHFAEVERLSLQAKKQGEK